MTRIAKHVAIAADKGMKAGFAAFMSNPGLLPVQNLVGGLSNRKAFAAYCGAYGPTVEGVTGSKPRKAAKAERTTTASLPKGEYVTALDGRTFLIVGGTAYEVENTEVEVGVEIATDKPRTVAPSKARKAKAPVELLETTFGAGVVKALGLPKVAGKGFTYRGKAGKSKWVVQSVNKDGSILANRA